MNSLTINNIAMSPKLAAELLALAPDVPPVMTDDAVMAAIGCVLDAHGGDLTMCLADLAYAYGDHPGEVAARMSRCVVYASRLLEVEA